MKNFFIVILLIFILLNIAYTKQINVVTTYPYISDITKFIGGNNINVVALAKGDYNPHIIIPKPSFIAKVRNADLLIINGAQLEIGWLPQILKQSNNNKVQSGEIGFLDLSNHVTLIDKPESVSRELGDVHPDGNPHYCLNPINILKIAQAIFNKLSNIDSDNKKTYQQNYANFEKQWNAKLEEWKEKLKPFKNYNIVEYHKVFDYFLKYFEINITGTIEPLPGIPPTTKHIEELSKKIENENIKIILQDVYNPKDAAEYLAKKHNAKVVILPHDVDAVNEAKDIFTLYEQIITRITN